MRSVQPDTSQTLRPGGYARFYVIFVYFVHYMGYKMERNSLLVDSGGKITISSGWLAITRFFLMWGMFNISPDWPKSAILWIWA